MEFLHIVTLISLGQTVIANNLLTSALDNFRNRPENYVCTDVEITDREGLITSPDYPSSYSSHISCSWHIIGNVGDAITIRFDDVDIEESCTSLSSPCCLYNWVKVGLLGNDTEKRLCGKNVLYHLPLVSRTHKLWIKFHISKYSEGGRGFQLHYKIAPRVENNCKSSEIRCDGTKCVSAMLRCNGIMDCEDGRDELHCSTPVLSECKINEFKCGSNRCLPASARCNGIQDCEDGSDEHHCSNRCGSGRSCRTVFQCYDAAKHCDGIADCADLSDEIDCGVCQDNLVPCGPNSTQCYNPLLQVCDTVFHCLNGEDEKDCSDLCPNKIMCNSRRGCYTMKHRCNGVAQCEDASDEKNCVPELCNYEHGGFLCDNGRCIQEVWTCDRTDDCGDGSDEKNCLRNSVLTAAVMGSLICALLLVIAISCTCRLHALRMLEQRLSRETPLSRLSREFFFREPPPSYAVAVQGSQHHNLYVENLHYGVPVHRGRRRSRRTRHSRNSLTGTQLPSVSRNCVLVNPVTTVSRHDAVSINTTGESSNPVPLAETSPIEQPGNKNECVISVSAGNPNVLKDIDDDKDSSVQSDSTCPVIRPSSDSESLSLEPINVCLEENSDSIQLTDHYCCDSDSEPLVP